jgi:4'-phosphopantetheinyl transferase
MLDEFPFAVTDWAPRRHHGIRSSSCAGRLVDVWVCSLRTDVSLDVSSRWLSAGERRRLGGFVRACDRLRFAVSHSLMRAILGHYLGTSPEQICLREGARGKPYVHDRNGAPCTLNFNLSHCEDRALVAVAQGRRIGVDIERESRDVDLAAVVRRFFSPAERRQFASQPRDERRAWFYRQWVAKEAVLKTHGGGLSVAPESFSVVFYEPGIATVVSSGAEPGGEWIVRTVDVGVGWHAAVASSGRDWELEVMMPVERPEA